MTGPLSIKLTKIRVQLTKQCVECVCSPVCLQFITKQCLQGLQCLPLAP